MCRIKALWSNIFPRRVFGSEQRFGGSWDPQITLGEVALFPRQSSLGLRASCPGAAESNSHCLGWFSLSQQDSCFITVQTENTFIIVIVCTPVTISPSALPVFPDQSTHFSVSSTIISVLPSVSQPMFLVWTPWLFPPGSESLHI